MSAITWTVKSTVIIRDHQPCLYTARLKHQALNLHVGRVFGRLDGRWRLISFWRSIHSRWGCVSRAVPVFALKFPMMILVTRMVSLRHRCRW
jgi:hypothetical protein